jgi:Kef-type K+ transport system membrane component KefB
LIGHEGGSASLPLRLVGLAVYLFLMVGVVRPFATRLSKRMRTTADLSIEMLGMVLAFTLISAAATQAIGVHPLFGAFMAGVCFPRVERWQTAMRAKLDMLISVLLLPLFFAQTGMRTRLDLMNGGSVWFWAGIVLVAAVFGKMGGAALAARWNGQTWKDAVALGTLLNTRGLVELIVLNIAYNVGAFTPTLFTMLVVMALVTTMITTPLLDVLGVQNAEKAAEKMEAAA